MSDLSYEEMVIESVVLSYVLRERPDGIEVPDLRQAIEARTLANDGEVERAVRRLVDRDYLRMKGQLVMAPFASGS